MGKGDVSEMHAAGYKPVLDLEQYKEKINEEEMIESLANKSFSSICKIIEFNLLNVLNGKKLRYNKLTHREEIGGEPVLECFADDLRRKIEDLFRDQKGNALRYPKNEVNCAIDLIAQKNSFHPVVDHINELKKWDGVHRIKNVLKDILGSEETAIYQKYIRKFFVTLIARPLNPGIKKDEVFILVGDQGIGKSTFFQILGGDWYRDDPIDMRKTSDAFKDINGAWIYEFGELSSVKSSDHNLVKLFLSKKNDKARKAYDKRDTYWNRQCVLVGTTNDDQFLTDPTGNRRFCILNCTKIDIDKLKEQRGQLLAEAKYLYDSGAEKVFFDRDEQNELEENNKLHEIEDPLIEPIEDLLKESISIPFKTMTVLSELRGQLKGWNGWGPVESRRICTILKKLGYEYKNVWHRGSQAKMWSKKMSR